MELAYAGLHQLCVPMPRPAATQLPESQQVAPQVALGWRAGDPPDRFLVALATLGLLSAVAEEQPLLCVVDDLQWLDDASAQALGFVARRLLAEPMALVFARARAEPRTRSWPACRSWRCAGSTRPTRAPCSRRSSRAGSTTRVRDRIVAETHGNPLALLELPRGMSAAELAGGFAPPAPRRAGRPASRSGFRRRLDALPPDTRRLLQLAAADPVGDPLLLWRAAERRWDPPGRRDAGGRRGPDRDRRRRSASGTRSCARRRIARPSTAERHALHAALAEATDAELHPDRRAWHRAQAAAGPDEEVAAELERSAARAQARGGVARGRPRSSRAPRRSRPIPPSACADCSPRRGPSATPARSTPPCNC